MGGGELPLMRPGELELINRLDGLLLAHSKSVRKLPGIADARHRDVLIRQLIESIRRVDYVQSLRKRSLGEAVANPVSPAFNPLKAAVNYSRTGEYEEAFWMTFLYIHFSRYKRFPWNYSRAIYSGLSEHIVWNWAAVSRAPDLFRKWLEDSQAEIKARGGGFGNHRKYTSLSGASARGTGAAVESYVEWVASLGDHQSMIQSAIERSDGDPFMAFDDLFWSMDKVVTFGRLAKFDYLTMVAKLGMAAIEPGSPYLAGATGPLRGAKRLFLRSSSRAASILDLDRWTIELGHSIHLGMQVLEDALCNWQKSPSTMVKFRS